LAADLYTVVLDAIKELLPRNYIGGLVLSNNGGNPATTIDIAPGECRGAADDESLRLASTLSKRINAAWAVGTNNGGLDTGVVGNNALYAMWLIKRTDTDVVDALYSLSFTAPTMPASYTKKRLVGAVRTKAAGALRSFVQVGDYFRDTDTIAAADVTDSTITDDTYETGTLQAPPWSLATVYVRLTNPTATGGVEGRVNIRHKGASDPAQDLTAFHLAQSSATFDALGSKGDVLVDGSSQMEYAADETSGSATVEITSIGFHMLTRREPV
jgi:hypothetical protein